MKCFEYVPRTSFATLHFLWNIQIGPISKRLIILARDKHSSLLGQFICCNENECCPQNRIHNTSLSLELTKRPNTQKCFITLGQKAFQWQTLQLIGPIHKLQRKWSVVIVFLGPYSQHFIFFVALNGHNKQKCCIKKDGKSCKGQTL